MAKNWVERRSECEELIGGAKAWAEIRTALEGSLASFGERYGGSFGSGSDFRKYVGSQPVNSSRFQIEIQHGTQSFERGNWRLEVDYITSSASATVKAIWYGDGAPSSCTFDVSCDRGEIKITHRGEVVDADRIAEIMLRPALFGEKP